MSHFSFKYDGISLFGETLPVLRVVKEIQSLQSFYPYFTEKTNSYGNLSIRKIVKKEHPYMTYNYCLCMQNNYVSDCHL